LHCACSAFLGAERGRAGAGELTSLARDGCGARGHCREPRALRTAWRGVCARRRAPGRRAALAGRQRLSCCMRCTGRMQQLFHGLHGSWVQQRSAAVQPSAGVLRLEFSPAQVRAVHRITTGSKWDVLRIHVHEDVGRFERAIRTSNSKVRTLIMLLGPRPVFVRTPLCARPPSRPLRWNIPCFYTHSRLHICQ